MNHAGLPSELKAMPSWCVWKKIDGRKIPYQLDGTHGARSNDSSTWATFQNAYSGLIETEGTFNGVCWMMPVKPSDIIFIDIDHCIKDGIIEPWAQKIIEQFNSYTERSQSGNGLHILITGKKPIKRCRKNGSPFEIYDSLRPCYLTGDTLETHTTIEARQEPLNKLFNEIFSEEIQRANEPQQTATPGKSSLSDEALILKATLAKGGDKFKALWDGATLGYGGDDSAADIALCNKLAFWTAKNGLQMDRLFRQSKLMRPKWDEKHGAQTYGEGTIQKAIDDTVEVYTPRREEEKHSGVLEFDDCFILMPVTDKKGNVVMNKETGEPLMKVTFSATLSNKSIEEKFNLGMVKGDEKKIWRFDGHIYRDNGRHFFKHAIYNVAEDAIKAKDVDEVFNRLTATLLLKPVVFNPDPFLFPAIDGVLDLKSGEIRDGAPADLMTFSYNAHCHFQNADYDRFLFYLASSLPDIRDCLTAIDLYTKSVIRVPFDTFAFLIGGGENGKGIFEKVLIELLGMGRVSAAKFDEFKRSHFALGGLIDKDVWVITEVETAKDATAVIKAVSSGEMIDSDVKYNTDRARGTPHLLPILDSNKAIDFKDPSWGRKRRTLKLDFPYEFGYKPESRPKDPHLLEKLKTPESLSGILQIIKARAPSLIAARKIYRRKSSEEQEAELDRQRFSLQYFCNDCLVKEADWPEKIDPMDKTTQPPRLLTDDAFKLYREYCQLWNVPEPAEKVPLGRYICEKFGVESAQSSIIVDGKKKTYRFYSGLFCGKLPVTAHADICVDYSEIPQSTPDIPQMWIGEKDISKDNTPDTPDKQVLLDIIEKLTVMYNYVQSCQSCRDITWEKFQAHLSGVSGVFKKNGPTDSENSYPRFTPDQKTSGVKSSPDSIPQMNQAQAVDQVQATAPSDRLSTPSVDGVKEKDGSGPHPRKDAPKMPEPDPLRALAISMYGVHGKVDPRKLVAELHISTNDTYCRLKALGYEAYDSQDGQTYFRQGKA
jgi:putative DNA primase/helicase